MESEKFRRSYHLAQRIGKLGREFYRAIDPNEPRVPLEKINQTSVAKVIVTQLCSPMRERMGQKRWDMSFSIVDILGNIGYVATWNNADYFKKFPEPYQHTRLALVNLCQQKALAMEELPERDINGEILEYKVENPALIEMIAAGRVVDNLGDNNLALDITSQVPINPNRTFTRRDALKYVGLMAAGGTLAAMFTKGISREQKIQESQQKDSPQTK